MQNFSLTTIRREELVFQSPNSCDICDLINFFLDGLKRNSKYVVATHDYRSDGQSTISFNQGDLIILEDGYTGEHVLKSGWVVGRLERTDEKGDIPTEYVFVLPTTSRPPNNILPLFSEDINMSDLTSSSPLHNGLNYNQMNGYDSHEKGPLGLPYSLEKYAIDHFRPPPKYTLPRTLTFSSARRRSGDQLWKHSREPIKQPLLKKLLNKEEFNQEACFAFNAILKYMGDLPSRRTRSGNDLTDQIFEGPLKFVRFKSIYLYMHDSLLIPTLLSLSLMMIVAIVIGLLLLLI